MNLNIYILSAGHSGSTLLDMMLGSHPSCESAGELIHLPMDMAMNKQCGCRQLMHDCVLWPAVMRRMGIDPLDDPYKLELGYAIAMTGDKKRTSAIHKIITRPKNALKYAELRWNADWMNKLTPGFKLGIQNTLDIYDHIRDLTEKNIVVDSSKHYLRAVELYKRNPTATRIIVLVRDGRGVFYSFLKRKFSRRFAMIAWRNHYHHLLSLLDKHISPSHMITVHYEKLIDNPRGTLKNICSFLELDFSESMIDFRSVVHHNVNGNDMKLLTASDLRLDETWKNALTQNDLAYFNQHAGYLNNRFGYI